MKGVYLLLLILTSIIIFYGCQEKQEQIPVLEMAEKGYNKFCLEPTLASGNISIYLQHGFSDVYLMNHNDQAVGIRLSYDDSTYYKEIGKQTWLKPEQEAVFLGDLSPNKKYLLQVRFYKHSVREDNFKNKDFDPLRAEQNEFERWRNDTENVTNEIQVYIVYNL